jgi:hypothetical protein
MKIIHTYFSLWFIPHSATSDIETRNCIKFSMFWFHCLLNSHAWSGSEISPVQNVFCDFILGLQYIVKYYLSGWNSWMKCYIWTLHITLGMIKFLMISLNLDWLICVSAGCESIPYNNNKTHNNHDSWWNKDNGATSMTH